MKPLPLIPVIEIDGGDPDLVDLLQVISESKVGSKLGISNSVNKSAPQEKEKEDTPIQKARSESLQKILLKSAAEKMIRLMNQPSICFKKIHIGMTNLLRLQAAWLNNNFPNIENRSCVSVKFSRPISNSGKFE
ncbi:hypothetical protein PIB30_066640 [Stylosanthes scabra]|uniref:Uncharacterized protein n=1 Tax=Stylosanthes scabra TaxID=79078 RepID=A0ABU6YN47_9FABA|nr:hypothetical protein [Stylosanthes scabra]